MADFVTAVEPLFPTQQPAIEDDLLVNRERLEAGGQLVGVDPVGETEGDGVDIDGEGAFNPYSPMLQFPDEVTNGRTDGNHSRAVPHYHARARRA